MTAWIHPTAIIEEDVVIGARSKIWSNVHIRHSTWIGEECIIGEKCYIAYNVTIGSRVKVKAFSYICPNVTIEEGVLINVGTIFTNDRFPRATTPDLKHLKSSTPEEADSSPLKTVIREGATIGAGCIIGNNLEVGRFAMVGMGSLVTKTVLPFHMVVGHPAISRGYVCRCGTVLAYFPSTSIPIEFQDIVCRQCGLHYAVIYGSVSELPVSKDSNFSSNSLRI